MSENLLCFTVFFSTIHMAFPHLLPWATVNIPKDIEKPLVKATDNHDLHSRWITQFFVRLRNVTRFFLIGIFLKGIPYGELT